MNESTYDERRRAGTALPDNWFMQGARHDRVLEEAEQYLEAYPHVPSAPRTLFWLAKLREAERMARAVEQYQRLLVHYPRDYYAFRGQGRLACLMENRPDPGWVTVVNRSYPPETNALRTFGLAQPETCGVGYTGDGESGSTLLAATASCSLRPAAKSWAAHLSGRPKQGIHIIGDALEERTRQAFLRSIRGEAFHPPGTHAELKLLYPIYYPDEIRDASKRLSLDPFLIQALMREESHFEKRAVSVAGAWGLMQLLPDTAEQIAAWEQLADFQRDELFSPAINIRLGARYLAYLHEVFQGNSMAAVGSYNGGPGAMRRWIRASDHFETDPDMFVETVPSEQSRRYIKKVFSSYWTYHRLYGPDGC